MNRIVFLGSGGGRAMIATQERRTGGLFIELGSVRFALDPGPGALVYGHALGLQPQTWHGLVLSHVHVDHSSDANALLDAMLFYHHESKEWPFCVAEKSCLAQIKDGPTPVISAYHQEKAKRVVAMDAGKKVTIGDVEIVAAPAKHYAPTVGFVIRHAGLAIGYTADTAYYPGVEKAYEGCGILIVNVMLPKGADPTPWHLRIDDVITFIKAMKTKPKLVVLHGLSPYIIRANLFKQEKILQDATGLTTISAKDFMELNLETRATRITAAKA